MRPTLAVAALSMLFVAGAAHAAASYSDVYFFGDSLTDTGNVSLVYAGLPNKPAGVPALPGVPYDPEGRFSNGLVYADVLAAGLGHDATASMRGGSNYAYGGARTRYQPSGPPFQGVGDQVASYRALPGSADPNALYVLWAGANNLQDILLGRTSDPLGNPIPGVGGTLGDIGTMIGGLYAEGVRHLLVPNVPNLGRVPRVAELGAAAAAGATGLVQAYNAGLTTVLDTLQSSLPGLELIRFDAYASFENLIANASALGFTNVGSRCYSGDDLSFTGGGTVCATPSQYVFWDGIHPTAKAHLVLGTQMLAVAAVPEPAAWAMMALGVLALGALRRRRG